MVGSFGLVGSSNFTFPGLVENIELNVQIRGPEVALLQEGYERFWKEAEDVSRERGARACAACRAYGARTDELPTNALPRAPNPDLGLRTENELPLA